MDWDCLAISGTIIYGSQTMSEVLLVYLCNLLDFS